MTDGQTANDPTTISDDGLDQSGVTITAIRATPIAVPLTFAYKWGSGAYPGFSRTLIEVETSAGISGLGESGNERDARVINELLAPRLVGADPLNRAACEARVVPSLKFMTTLRDFSRLNAFTGIEMALWDIAGKVSGRSLASLLGGRVRNAIPVTHYFALDVDSPNDFVGVANGCAAAMEHHGARSFEGKVGALPLRDEVRYVSTIRDALGDDVPIRLDANMSWDVPTAKLALREFAQLGVAWIEEPVRLQHELASLAAETPISFSSHQPDLPAAVRDHVPHAYVIADRYMGGIQRTVDFVRACTLFGIDVWFRAPTSGIGTAAELQIASALAEIKEPSQNLGYWIDEDIVEQGPFRASNGVISVPDGPGLGVTLHRDGVRRCAERAAAAPLNNPFA